MQIINIFSYFPLLQIKYILFVGENAAEHQQHKNVPNNLE